jgi:hypothetical protein
LYRPPGEELAGESSHNKKAGTVDPQDERMEDISSIVARYIAMWTNISL